MASANLQEVSAALFNVATLSGKIDAVKAVDKGFYTHLVTPAPDAYSHPQVLEIRSKKRLGQIGEEIRVGVNIGGFRRKFQYDDKNTGEEKKGESVRISLDAIED